MGFLHWISFLIAIWLIIIKQIENRWLWEREREKVKKMQFSVIYMMTYNEKNSCRKRKSPYNRLHQLKWSPKPINNFILARHEPCRGFMESKRVQNLLSMNVCHLRCSVAVFQWSSFAPVPLKMVLLSSWELSKAL